MDANASLPAAILWDMDGTLMDTEPYWIRAEIDLCAAHGRVWTHEDGLTIVGRPLPVSAQAIKDRGLDITVLEIIDALMVQVTAGVRQHVPWQEDARRLLDRAIAQGIPCALVTSSYGTLVEAFLAEADVFDAVVTGADTTNGKPHPEAYLKAAQALGVPISDCLAIEDSPSGIRSAHASGARAVGVKRLTPVPVLPGLSRVRSLDSLTDEAIAAIMGGAVVDELGGEV